MYVNFISFSFFYTMIATAHLCVCVCVCVSLMLKNKVVNVRSTSIKEERDIKYADASTLQFVEYH
jgi:hypothetical protein